MRRADLSILMALVAVGAVAVFWFMLLAPKREKAAELGERVAELQESVASAEDDAAFAEAARDDYDGNYHRLVVLGKAVPEDSDTPSLLVELQKLADRSKVSFDALALAENAEGPQPAAAAPATPPAGEAGAASGGEAEGAAPPAAGGSGSAPAPTNASQESGATPTSTTAPATEAAAATLPIGAAVGPAGYPAMPYDLSFTGNYFEVADFFDGLDDLVHTADGDVSVDGRLLTVDGFTLAAKSDETTGTDTFDPTPVLSVTLAATTFLTPAEQGLTAGAEPSAPAPTTPAAPTTTSTTAPAP